MSYIINSYIIFNKFLNNKIMEQYTNGILKFPNLPNPDPISTFLLKFNQMCIGIFNPQTSFPNIEQYQKELQILTSDPQYFNMLIHVVNSTPCSESCFFACAIATSHIKRFGNFFAPKNLIELGNTVFNLMFLQPNNYPEKTLGTAYQLLSTILKYTWFETENSLKNFIDILLEQEPITEKCLEFFQIMVDEMQSIDTRISALYRRVYFSFETKYLGKIARACILAILQFTDGKELNFSLIKSALQTLNSCLKYNFQTGKEDDTCDFYVFFRIIYFIFHSVLSCFPPLKTLAKLSPAGKFYKKVKLALYLFPSYLDFCKNYIRSILIAQHAV